MIGGIKEAVSAARDGGELRPVEQEEVAQERAEAVLYFGNESDAGVPLHLLRDPHRQRGTLGGATARAATRKGGVAKCHK